MRRISIFIFTIVYTLASFGQFEDVSVSYLNLSDKLPVNEITQIFQDSEGFMWYGTVDGLCRDDGYSIHVFRKNLFDPNSVDVNVVNSIAEDKSNHLWIGTAEGLVRMDRATFAMLVVGDEELKKSNVSYMLTARDGTVWAMGRHHLYHLDANARILKKYAMPEGISCLYEDSKRRLFVSRFDVGVMMKTSDSEDFVLINSDYNVSAILEDSAHGCYWLCDRDKGFVKYVEHERGKAGTIIPQKMVYDEYNIPVTFFTHLVQDDRFHYIWAISFYRGLHAFEVGEDGNLKRVSTKGILPQHNQILYNIIKSNNGNLWVTGFDTNSFVINLGRKQSRFNPMNQLEDMTNLSPAIISLTRDQGGVFWLKQKRNDLFLYNPETGVCRSYAASLDPGKERLFLTRKLVPSRLPNSMWAIMESGVVVKLLSRRGMDVRVDRTLVVGADGRGSGAVISAFEDSRQQLWLGCEKGLYLYRMSTDEIVEAAPSLGAISDIAEDSDGNIWCTVRNKGLVKIPPKGRFALYPVGLDLLTLAVSNGLIWVGSREGKVMKFVESLSEGHQFIDQTHNCGMNGDRIVQIEVDCYDHVWVMTNQRVKEFNPLNGAFRVFSTFDSQVPMQRFMPQSAYVDPVTDKIYVGGIPGFVSFTPLLALEGLHQDVRLHITDVTVNGSSVWFSQVKRGGGDRLLLPSDAKNIAISFSSLDYEHVPYIRYAYMMEGVDDDWVVLENGTNTAVYNRLPQGRSVLKIRVTDSNGMWVDHVTTLMLKRAPAWYETVWAYILYFLLAVGAVVLAFYIYKCRLQRQSHQELQENIVQAKLVYFTSISHELLTPLTIIKCLAEQLASSEGDPKQKIELIVANVTRLRRLLQQVLDFRKVESRNMKLFVEKDNVTAFLMKLCKESFEPLAANKSLQFLTKLPVTDIVGYFDRDKLEKILFNLVSNAIKYTPEGRSVTLSAKLDYSGQLLISVKDKGVGIDQREQKFIFTRFYSSKTNDNATSNGIGLSLTKELVELYRGSIHVVSQLGKGSEFTVILPIKRDDFTADEIKEDIKRQPFSDKPAVEVEIKDVSDEMKENLLMVEDNLELLSIMQELLSKRYNVFVATNGEEALEVVGHENIDIIVSDISMPGMDGIELCRHIKSNVNTSDLVFVLLTARISTDAQAESYGAGADAYLTKPFETEALLKLLDSLHKQREKRQEEFRRNLGKMSIELVSENIEMADIDQQFVQKAARLVEEHLASPLLDVEFLASHMGMSRSTLSRKLKTLTGQTAFDFMKGIRLRYAYKLLQSHTRTVAEVMDRVGYNDHRSFAQSFKEMFGMLPSEVK